MKGVDEGRERHTWQNMWSQVELLIVKLKKNLKSSHDLLTCYPDSYWLTSPLASSERVRVRAYQPEQASFEMSM